MPPGPLPAWRVAAGGDDQVKLSGEMLNKKLKRFVNFRHLDLMVTLKNEGELAWECMDVV